MNKKKLNQCLICRTIRFLDTAKALTIGFKQPNEFKK